jgi:ferrous iron transport protein A
MLPSKYARKILPLAVLPLDTPAQIMAIKVSDCLKRRLLDLGFIPGTEIRAVFSSPFGDPRAYEIRGTLLALRTDEAKSILVRGLDTWLI